MPTVREIVRKHLEREGYDGLYNEAGECGCLKEDLAPCCQISELCEAGYRVECAGCAWGAEPHWHIVGEKPEEKK